MIKKIHYCWFGGKPLPKSAKKCIKTWKKYLPDYEIIEWNESNFDINSIPFVKDAYESKKWAFVSDYARIYALYNEGGIYFDTDMKVTKGISHLENDDVFLGVEDSGYIAAGVIGVKEAHNKFIKKLYDYYNSLEHFYPEASYSFAIPRVITEVLKNDKFKTKDYIRYYDNGVVVYPRDYFYPLSYNHNNNIFTDNTCMIHMYDATWTSRGERRTNFINRAFGTTVGGKINSFINWIGKVRAKFANFVKSRINACALQYSIYFHKNKRVKSLKNTLSNQKEKYLGICHPEWIGVKNSTYSLFNNNVIEVREQYRDKEAKEIAQTIIDANKKFVVFSGFAKGWDKIINALKELDPKIKIDVLVHGSNALLCEDYDWNVNISILALYNMNKIDEIAFVKKSLYEFYKEKGYRVKFIMNNIIIDEKEKYKEESKKEKQKKSITKIGMYSSADRWVKNIYNQVSAASLIENPLLDCVPLNDKEITLAREYGLNITGVNKNIPKEELYKRMANNDINLYVTFTECSPLIPLESMELGTLCITGDNHHYYKNTELEKYLVVSKEDDIMAIYEKMKYALENKDKIFEIYNKWKKQYDKDVEKNHQEFLEMK